MRRRLRSGVDALKMIVVRCCLGVCSSPNSPVRVAHLCNDDARSWSTPRVEGPAGAAPHLRFAGNLPIRVARRNLAPLGHIPGARPLLVTGSKNRNGDKNSAGPKGNPTMATSAETARPGATRAIANADGIRIRVFCLDQVARKSGKNGGKDRKLRCICSCNPANPDSSIPPTSTKPKNGGPRRGRVHFIHAHSGLVAAQVLVERFFELGSPTVGADSRTREVAEYVRGTAQGEWRSARHYHIDIRHLSRPLTT